MFYRLVIILLLFQVQVQLKAQNNTAILSGSIEGAQEGDTVSLYIWDSLIDYSMRYITKHREFTSPIHDGTFKFSIPNIDQPTYFSLGLAKQKFQGKLHEILSLHLMEPGDNVKAFLIYSNIKNKVASGDGSFDSNEYKASFTGTGSDKYNLAFKLKSTTSPLAFLNRIDFKEAKKFSTDEEYGNSEYQLNLWNQLKVEAEVMVDSYKGKIKDDILRLLEIDCIAGIEWSKLYKYYGLASINQSADAVTKARRMAKLNTLYDRYCSSVSFDTSDSTICRAPYLVKYINYRIINDLIRNNINTRYQGVYESVKSNYSGDFRDRLILSNYFSGNAVDYFLRPDKQEIVKDMLKTVSNYNYYTILQEYVSRAALGTPVKEFSLPDANGKYISIAGLKGKVVFIDLWYSGCGGCAAYYKSVLTKVEGAYKKNDDVVFITISIDGSKDIWLRGLKGGAYTGEHAINLYTDGQGTQHPFIRHYNITGYPSLFLIDKEGILIQRGNPLRSEQGLIKEIEAALAKPMASDKLKNQVGSSASNHTAAP